MWIFPGGNTEGFNRGYCWPCKCQVSALGRWRTKLAPIISSWSTDLAKVAENEQMMERSWDDLVKYNAVEITLRALLCKAWGWGGGKVVWKIRLLFSWDRRTARAAAGQWWDEGQGGSRQPALQDGKCRMPGSCCASGAVGMKAPHCWFAVSPLIALALLLIAVLFFFCEQQREGTTGSPASSVLLSRKLVTVTVKLYTNSDLPYRLWICDCPMIL